MKKYAVVSVSDLTWLDTYEAAEEKAKRRVSQGSYAGKDHFILEQIALVKAPVPDAIVTKL